MKSNMTRRAFIGVSGLAGLALLGGCAGGQASSAGSAASSGSAAASGAESGAAGKTIHIGTLATEDILPFWVAAEDGLFAKEGLDVDIVQFQSATELISGVSSGEVDLAMTDIMVTASMVASGTDVQMQWVTLGTDASQGRFGIMAGPDSKVEKLTDLAGVPIGVGSNTILEYVMDKLMEAAGVPADQIVVEELQKLPVRYQTMVEGNVAAAALPGTLLALGEADGCKLIADDSKGENLSQSVMIAQGALLASDDGKQKVELLKSVWDTAAKMVNANPESFRDVLVANANLPEKIADTYPISTYPTVQLPTAAMVDPVLAWMEQKSYLAKPLAYDEATGKLSAN